MWDSQNMAYSKTFTTPRIITKNGEEIVYIPEYLMEKVLTCLFKERCYATMNPELYSKKKLSVQKETQLTDLFPSEAHHRASFPDIGTGEQGKAGT